MNQALQFIDDEQFEPQEQRVRFSALQNGLRLTCVITEAELHRRYGEAPALELFRQHRFDIEDEAEQLIVNHQEDEQGWYWLSCK